MASLDQLGAAIRWTTRAKVVTVHTTGLPPLEEPESYSKVPRRIHGRDGVIEPWSGEIS